MRRLTVLALLAAFVLMVAPVAPPLIGAPARAAPLSKTYLPLVMRPPAIDLSVDVIEVTQAVQDASNTVPLVAGRSTVVRVYARASGAASPGNVTVSLQGTCGGSALPGSPLTLGPMAISSSPTRGSYASSANFALPATWLGQGTLSLAAAVDSQGMVAETNEGNNTAAATVTLNSVPALSIMIVPIRYTHTPSMQVYPPPAVDTISSWIRRAYPLSQVNVSWHAAVPFQGDLKTSSGSWLGLLELVTSTKSGDHAPSSQVYYGFVSTSNGTSDWLGSGGIVGIGWVGLRAAAGLDLPAWPFGVDAAGQNAAHEIGHNLGRNHAPCGNPSNVDPYYPYAGGYVGQYGLDMATNTVWGPTAAYDLMSYCQPQWLSDYTYRGLYDDQRLRGAALLAGRQGDGLLVRAVLDREGARLLPVYALPGAPLRVEVEGDYAVELLDHAGATVASYPVQVYEVAQPDPAGTCEGCSGVRAWVAQRMVHALVPLPPEPAAWVRLVQGERVLAERGLGPPTGVGARLLSAEGGELALQWDAPETPALVRYTEDGGQTWVTLAVDALGGELAVDVASLPERTGRFEVILGDQTATAVRVE